MNLVAWLRGVLAAAALLVFDAAMAMGMRAEAAYHRAAGWWRRRREGR